MGSCVSVHKHPSSSAINLRFSIDPKNQHLSIPSPVKKESTDLVNAGHRTVGDVLLDSHSSPPRFVHGVSKDDDSFFDSQPWLDSDCEDDFVSVNGDFTPSRGNTPVHHNFSSRSNEVITDVPSIPDQSPDKKKRLSELFKDSLRNLDFSNKKHNLNEQLAAKGTKSAPGTPHLSLSRAKSTASSEMTSASGELGGGGDEKWLKSGQCYCLPKMISSRSFNERKKRMSPARKDE